MTPIGLPTSDSEHPRTEQVTQSEMVAMSTRSHSLRLVGAIYRYKFWSVLQGLIYVNRIRICLYDTYTILHQPVPLA